MYVRVCLRQARGHPIPPLTSALAPSTPAPRLSAPVLGWLLTCFGPYPARAATVAVLRKAASTVPGPVLGPEKGRNRCEWLHWPLPCPDQTMNCYQLEKETNACLTRPALDKPQ